jgi:hypothetical protein
MEPQSMTQTCLPRPALLETQKPRSLSALFNICAALLVLLVLSACKPEETEVAVKSIVLPTTDVDADWKEFVSQVARSKFIKGKTKKLYVRFLGSQEDTKGHLRDTINIFTRGVENGTLQVFGSQNSRNMSELLVEAFNTEYIDGKLNGSRFVFIGQRQHEAAVRDAAIKSGVTFEFYPID